jgi:hypothetical protein
MNAREQQSSTGTAEVLDYIDGLIWDVIYADRRTQAADRSNYPDQNEGRIEAWNKLQGVIREWVIDVPAQQTQAWGQWTPDQFWEYVEGLTDAYTRDCMRDMLASRGISFASAQQAPDPDDVREVAVKANWQRRWPHDQPNGWNLDGAGFLKLVQENPYMWLALGRAKYLELRIDTRDGAFNLYDRDKKPLNPDDVIEAINKVRKDFGDAAVSSTSSGTEPSAPAPESSR